MTNTIPKLRREIDYIDTQKCLFTRTRKYTRHYIAKSNGRFIYHEKNIKKAEYEELLNLFKSGKNTHSDILKILGVNLWLT